MTSPIFTRGNDHVQKRKAQEWRLKFLAFSRMTKTLFTWSGGPRSSGVSFFYFHALRDTKQKKLTPLDRGPSLHVNRVWDRLRRHWRQISRAVAIAFLMKILSF